MLAQWLHRCALGLLPLLGSAGLGPCEAQGAYGKCGPITAEATTVHVSAGVANVGGLTASSSDPNLLLTGASITLYRDHNEVRGYQNPPDEFVSQLSASGPPTNSISLGNFSSQDPVRGNADAWELVVDLAGGGSVIFSGWF